MVGVKDGWGKGRECSNCLSFLKKMTLHDINGTVVLMLSGVTMGSGAQGGAKYLDCAPPPGEISDILSSIRKQKSILILQNFARPFLVIGSSPNSSSVAKYSTGFSDFAPPFTTLLKKFR